MERQAKKSSTNVATALSPAAILLIAAANGHAGPAAGGGARGDGGGMIDYISFSQLFTPYTLPSFTSRCRDVGPLALATPTDEEVALLGRTSERLHGLAEEAARCGTRLLIDAEHTKYQPAIDNLVLELQRKYNAADRPVVFNTYQVSVCY
jgi:proline dehydrogenase